MKKKKIVIVGGGFAGIRLILDLQKHVYKDAEVTLIDDTGFHEYTPSFYKIAAIPLPEAGEQKRASFEELHSRISIPITDIVDTAKIRLLTERVESIDAENKTIRFQSGKSSDFDWLVLAAGSMPRFFDIPDLENYAYTLSSAHNAFNIRNAIHELFSRAAKSEKVRILIGGGGFTGSELAAALVVYIQILARRHGHPASNSEITIVEAASRILPGANQWISRKAEKRLRNLGIKIILNKSIVSAAQNSIKLKTGEELNCDIMIWTAGVTANQLSHEIKGAKLDEKSCLIVDDHLRVVPHDNIFAIGDMAFCSSVGIVGSSMTAQVAIRQGRYLAHTLKRILHKRQTFPYYFHRPKMVIPLDSKYVLADLGWIKFAGFMAWCLKSLIALHYLTTILPWPKALARWKQNR